MSPGKVAVIGLDRPGVWIDFYFAVRCLTKQWRIR